MYKFKGELFFYGITDSCMYKFKGDLFFYGITDSCRVPSREGGIQNFA